MAKQENSVAKFRAVHLWTRIILLSASLVFIGAVSYLALFAPEHLNNISAMPIIGVVLGAAVAYIATASMTRFSEGEKSSGNNLKVTLPGLEFSMDGAGQFFVFAMIFFIATASYFVILTGIIPTSG